MTTTTPRIAIIGAGPAGLAVARTLHLAGIRPTIYDADASLASRNQGGTLDLHADSGQIAIEDMHLEAEFAALARPEGQSHRMLAPDGTVLSEQIAAPDTFAAPEIDRGQLRTMLAESVLAGDPDAIRWSHRVERVETNADGSSTISFTGREAVVADLVIGADGGWSRVRRILTDALPHYSGVSFVEVVFSDVAAQHPAIGALVGDGHMWANGDGRAIILQRNSGDVVRGYLGMRIDLDWLAQAGLGASDGRGGVRASDGRGGVALDANATQRLGDPTSVERVRAVLLEEFADFAPELREVIARSEGSLPNRPIFGLATPTSWRHVAGVTVIGDAAHVMAPFGGNGVNLAMLDGVELAHDLVAAIEDGATNAAGLDAAIVRHEERMLARSNPIAEGANGAIVEHFAAGGPDIDAIPDFDEEAARWQADAEAYRAAGNTRA
jgi:2-polyprenyl-6-methoxyphenol hydroxylase-like FAD-dependent oxidoreductase